MTVWLKKQYIRSQTFVGIPMPPAHSKIANTCFSDKKFCINFSTSQTRLIGTVLATKNCEKNNKTNFKKPVDKLTKLQ